MTSPRIERANEIAAEISEALEAAGVEDVKVTLDPRDVAQHARLKAGGAIQIRPPALRFPTYHHTEATWTIVVAYGTADALLASWTRLDEIIAALAPSLDVTVAQPSSFETNDRREAPIPAYELTFAD